MNQVCVWARFASKWWYSDKQQLEINEKKTTTTTTILNHSTCRWMFPPHETRLFFWSTCEVETQREGGTSEVSAVGQKSLAPRRRTWGKGQNILGPHTQSPRRSRGVNPVSNKLGLTPVIPPAATATEAATHDEIPAPLSHMCHYFDSHVVQTPCRQTRIVWPQSGAFRCVICSQYPTFKQLRLWSAGNVDSCGSVA